MNRNFSLENLKLFFPYLKSFKKEIIFASFLGIINGVSVVTLTYYIGKAVDTMIGQGKVILPELIKIIFFLSLITVIASISQWLIQILGNKIAYYSVRNLRKSAFNHLNQLSINYYDRTSHGDLMSRFSNDLDYVSEACSAIFNQLFSGVTIVLISLFSMIWLSPLLTVIVLISTFFIFLVNWIVATRSQKQFGKQQKQLGEIAGFLSESVTHLKVIKAFEYEEESQKSFDSLNQELLHVGQKAQFVSSLTNPLSRFVDHLAYLAIGLVGGLLVINGSGNITVGIITSFILYSSQFSKPFIELSGMMTQIQTALAGLDRIFKLLNEETESDDSHGIALPTIHGKIEFRHVDFSYDVTRPLIEDFNLVVNPGETIAIVGKTGAGKSTLVNLLMRFYDVTSGCILIDDTPITDMRRDDLRSSFGMVLQETWLFNGTIWDNLTFGNPNATKEQVIKACKDASIYHFITTLPNEFETMIGQSGVTISDGQKQLLTIARTMISNPKMLILDEATSSVDTLTEQLIQEAFFKMMDGKTSFVIAHRLSTIQKADKILVMEQGQIVEIGSHHELLQNKDGFYSDLYHSQFKQV